MDGVELNALVEDIRSHGLLEPIVVLDGQVLDGRNRLRACEIAGVEPTFVEWTANGMSPTEWVVSHNLHRRHLTTAQRAALALDLLPRLEAEARERMLAGKADPSPESDEGRSDAKAADLVGVGRSTVAAAKAIQRRDETGAIVDGMRAGELNVAQAAREAGFEGMAQGGLGQGAIGGRRDARGAEQPATYFGKGDKWAEASEPLRRYLAAHARRNYEFSHIAPKEARKRVKTIDQLIEGLAAAKADLEERSHVYRLTA
jgi:hypothetical protein